MFAGTKIFAHFHTNDPTREVHYRVVTTVDGEIVSDLEHREGFSEGLGFIDSPTIHEETVGQPYSQDLYPDTTVEVWQDIEVGIH